MGKRAGGRSLWFSSSVFHWECFQEFDQRSRRRKSSYHIKNAAMPHYVENTHLPRKTFSPHNADCKVVLNCVLGQMIAIAMWGCLQHLGVEGNKTWYMLWQVPVFQSWPVFHITLGLVIASSAGWDAYPMLWSPAVVFLGTFSPPHSAVKQWRSQCDAVSASE